MVKRKTKSKSKGRKRKKSKAIVKKDEDIHGEGWISDAGHYAFESAGTTIGTALGGTAGAAAGGATGTALGLATGPAAVFVSPVLAAELGSAGAVAGAAAGGAGGFLAGEKIADWIFGEGLSARPIQARPKGIKIKKRQPSSTVLISKNGRISNQTFGRGKMNGRGKLVRQGTFGTISSEFGKVKF